MKPHYIERTYGETDHWYWLNRYFFLDAHLVYITGSSSNITTMIHNITAKIQYQFEMLEKMADVVDISVLFKLIFQL